MQPLLQGKPEKQGKNSIMQKKKTTKRKRLQDMKKSGQQKHFPAKDEEDVETELPKRTTTITLILIGVAVSGLVIVAGVLIAKNAGYVQRVSVEQWHKCTSENNECSIFLSESIPVNLTYPPGSPMLISTYDTWKLLIDMATESIDIASYYWTLRGQDVYIDPTDIQGELIFASLLRAGTERGIAIRIAQNKPGSYTEDTDTYVLAKAGAATVRSLDFDKLIGAGILHTKLWIIDNKHVFVGSPNMDWRSLTQVKELGMTFLNCGCISTDAAKLFEVYWELGQPDASVPSYWPANLSTAFNKAAPMQIMANGTEQNVYFASSPPPFCPAGRTTDIDALLDVMDNAQRFIDVAVMDYLPFMAYSDPQRFWPVINDKLFSAAYDRQIAVRLLVSNWTHSEDQMFGFLRSIAELKSTRKMNIEVKLFVVPASEEQAQIPYARVNHNKYMVTDRQAYVGTSNWSEDYFKNTGGVSVIINSTSESSHVSSQQSPSIRQQLAGVFERDWNSQYATYVECKYFELL